LYGLPEVIDVFLSGPSALIDVESNTGKNDPKSDVRNDVTSLEASTSEFLAVC
jgi:hypothetical protein